LSRASSSNWRRRFAERGLGGLNDRPRAFRRWRDNVFVERLWRSAKYEEVYLRAYDSISDAATRLVGISIPQRPTPPLEP
jgi:hypothetical protein